MGECLKDTIKRGSRNNAKTNLECPDKEVKERKKSIHYILNKRERDERSQSYGERASKRGEERGFCREGWGERLRG